MGPDSPQASADVLQVAPFFQYCAPPSACPSHVHGAFTDPHVGGVSSVSYDRVHGWFYPLMTPCFFHLRGSACADHGPTRALSAPRGCAVDAWASGDTVSPSAPSTGPDASVHCGLGSPPVVPTHAPSTTVCWALCRGSLFRSLSDAVKHRRASSPDGSMCSPGFTYRTLTSVRRRWTLDLPLLVSSKVVLPPWPSGLGGGRVWRAEFASTQNAVAFVTPPTTALEYSTRKGVTQNWSDFRCIL